MWVAFAATGISLPWVGVPIILYAIAETIFLTLWFDIFRRNGNCTNALALTLLSVIYLGFAIIG